MVRGSLSLHKMCQQNCANSFISESFIFQNCLFQPVQYEIAASCFIWNKMLFWMLVGQHKQVEKNRNCDGHTWTLSDILLLKQVLVGLLKDRQACSQELCDFWFWLQVFLVQGLCLCWLIRGRWLLPCHGSLLDSSVDILQHVLVKVFVPIHSLQIFFELLLGKKTKNKTGQLSAKKSTFGPDETSFRQSQKKIIIFQPSTFQLKQHRSSAQTAKPPTFSVSWTLHPTNN